MAEIHLLNQKRRFKNFPVSVTQTSTHISFKHHPSYADAFHEKQKTFIFFFEDDDARAFLVQTRHRFAQVSDPKNVVVITKNGFLADDSLITPQAWQQPFSFFSLNSIFRLLTHRTIDRL